MECPICLTKTRYNIETECKHVFCDLCMIRQLLQSSKCPLCRSECNFHVILEQINTRRQRRIMQKLHIRNSELHQVFQIQVPEAEAAPQAAQAPEVAQAPEAERPLDESLNINALISTTINIIIFIMQVSSLMAILYNIIEYINIPLKSYNHVQ